MQKAVMSNSSSKIKGLKKILAISALGIAMPFAINGCGLVVAGAAAGGAATAVTTDTRNVYTMAYDEQIEQQAAKIIKSNSLLSKSTDTRIVVTAFNGNVLITGQTINRDYIKWCVKKIEQLEHVRKVYNYATLQKPVSSGVITSDSYITSKVRTQLLFGKDINSNRFKIVTENGHVYLMGLVTRDESQRAINTVLGIDGVRKVYHIFDYITVQNNNGNGRQADDRFYVTPEKTSKSVDSNYTRQTLRTSRTSQSSSTYVPPVESSQNGGAYIMEEEVAPASSGASSLLLPADQY